MHNKLFLKNIKILKTIIFLKIILILFSMVSPNALAFWVDEREENINYHAINWINNNELIYAKEERVSVRHYGLLHDVLFPFISNRTTKKRIDHICKTDIVTGEESIIRSIEIKKVRSPEDNIKTLRRIFDLEFNPISGKILIKGHNRSVYTMNEDGSNLQLLVTGGSEAFFSKDGSKVFFIPAELTKIVGGWKPSYELWGIELLNEKIFKIADLCEWAVAHPDGKRIIYCTFDKYFDERTGINKRINYSHKIINLDGTGEETFIPEHKSIKDKEKYRDRKKMMYALREKRNRISPDGARKIVTKYKSEDGKYFGVENITIKEIRMLH